MTQHNKLKNFIFNKEEINKRIVYTILGMKFRHKKKKPLTLNEIKFYTTQMIKRTVPMPELLSVQIDICDHCNLNCKSCDHFSPLAEKKHIAVEDFKKDFSQLAKISNKKIGRIILLGGEPLLHPNLLELVSITRKLFPNSEVEIFSNGILLQTMKEEFWNCCRENNVIIATTRYPINVDYEKIGQIAEKYSVQYICHGNKNERKTTNHFCIDMEGKQNPVESFINCEAANNCVMLKDGRLYTCTIAPNIKHFNKFFNKKLCLTDEDGINIYEARDMAEILNFLARPIPFCKYCNVQCRTYGGHWEISKKQIEEWI